MSLLLFKRRPKFNLRELFLTDRAAGSLGGQTIPCQPGPGSLTYTDVEGKLSVAGGRALFGVPAAPAWGREVICGPSGTNTCGRTMLGRITDASTWGIHFGFGMDAYHGADGQVDSLYLTGSEVRIHNGVTAWKIADYTSGAEYDCIVIQRATGTYLLGKTASEASYKLLWVTATANGATAAPKINSPSGNNTAANLRVLSLAALDPRFATDDGLATSVLANPIAGATAVMTSDAVGEIVITYSAENYIVQYRYKDANNFWDIGARADGSLTIREMVGGTLTTRLTTAGVFTAGQQYRIVSIVEAGVHTAYVNNTQRGSYTDPNLYHRNETGMRVSVVGVNGVTRLAAFPRYATLPML